MFTIKIASGIHSTFEVVQLRGLPKKKRIFRTSSRRSSARMSTEQKTVEKKKAVRKPRPPASHPPYNEMVVAAITALKERNGSSRQKIIKYIRDHYTVSEGFETHVKLALKRGVTKGTLSQTKGTGASGSFKVVQKETKPAAKKPAVKKAPAKPKQTTKTAKPKKPAGKKAAPAKAAKPKPKKPAGEKKKTTPKKATTH